MHMSRQLPMLAVLMKQDDQLPPRQQTRRKNGQI